jgi:short-subunit dehydrogenase
VAAKLQNRFGGPTSLKDRVVLITGASDGIGAACARALQARGARLALSGRSLEKLTTVARPDDLTIAADLTHSDSPQLLIDRTITRFGRLDILINNAGHGIYWPVSASPDDATRALFDLNFFAPFALCQAAIPIFRKQRTGMIVNIGSIAGSVVLPWMPLYSASKSALAALTESLRMELARDNIHVMLVCPGYILTSFHEHSFGLTPPARVSDGKRFAITPDQCATDIVRGIERRARDVITPRWAWFLIAMHRLAPRAVEAHLMQLNHYPEVV